MRDRAIVAVPSRYVRLYLFHLASLVEKREQLGVEISDTYYSDEERNVEDYVDCGEDYDGDRRSSLSFDPATHQPCTDLHRFPQVDE